jgi:hypothetical protein
VTLKIYFSWVATSCVVMTINGFSEERYYVPVSQATSARAYKIAVFTDSLLFVGFVLWCIRLVSFCCLNLTDVTLRLRWRVAQRVKGKAVPLQAWSGPEVSRKLRSSSPVTGLEWPRGFQEVKVKQSRYRPGVAQRVPGS